MSQRSAARATSDGPSATGERPGSPTLMLVMATLGFAVNFWAWALISPLGPMFRDTGSLGELTESDVALLVAVPVIVGSLGRIVVGALTDRYGGRVMFPLISAITIVPILFIAFVALDSYSLLLVGGFFLGIAGTAFAVGVPFVNAWFPPERRGLAIGVFGAGMGGTAISALTTVKLYTNVGEKRAVPHHRGRPRGLRRGLLAGAARRPRPGGADDTAGHPAGRQRAGCRSPGRPASCTPSRSAATSPSRSTCRPTSRPPTGSPRADAANRMAGLRRRRGRDAPRRRLALRPVRPDPGARPASSAWWRSARRSPPAPRRSTGSARWPSW